jgi:hypothetical protein
MLATFGMSMSWLCQSRRPVRVVYGLTVVRASAQPYFGSGFVDMTSPLRSAATPADWRGLGMAASAHAHYVRASVFCGECGNERIAASRRSQAFENDRGATLERLDSALHLTDQVQVAYLLASPGTRRLFNRAIFSGF